MRKPDLIIGPLDNPYMLRWVLFRFRGWQLSLHKIVRSDDDRALHDHTADNWSLILRGQYTEFSGKWGHGMVYGPLSLVFRKAETPHRLVLNDGEVTWTLWLRAPSRREWGFHCPKGWRHWKEYCDLPNDYYKREHSIVGKGCDE